MLANAGIVTTSALAGQTGLSVVTITIALLLTPLMPIAGLLRWRQGSQGAAVYSLAWVFLMLGLFGQALRDLGFVPYTLTTYYWPIVASYAEMGVIVAAIGVDLRDLGEKKRVAEREARTDALTGIDNRRSFMLQAEELMDRCRDRGDGFHIIMMDIDHFKQVNDDHGHDVGDRTLRAFAATISSQIRDLDVFGRLGGKEFGLAMSGSIQSTLRIAERLRESVKNLRIDTEQGPIHIAASVGVAQLTNEATLGELLRKADKALYEAKRAGRDRVILRDDGAFQAAREFASSKEAESLQSPSS
jgi:diguanylate cyclase (GGDEF)-like protein